jgi:hypothetical protein
MAIETFIDRRHKSGTTTNERRQFGNSYADLSPAAQELGEAIDRYKLMNRRRYVTYEEMLSVVESLGYSKNS